MQKVPPASELIADAGCKRVRKDSIRVFDALYTASAESMESMTFDEQMSFFRDCVLWHCRHLCDGNPKYLLNAVIHFDEQTPHLHVSSVPIVKNDDGTNSLSAKKILGDGNRNYMRQLQDSFFDEVSIQYGFERGEVKETAVEKREHLTVQDYKIEQRAADLERLEIQIHDAQEHLDSINAELERSSMNLIEQQAQVDEFLATMTKPPELDEIAARTREKRGTRIRSIEDDDVILEAAKAAVISAERLKTVKQNYNTLNKACNTLDTKLQDAKRRAEMAELWKDATRRDLFELARKLEPDSPPRHEILRIAGMESEMESHVEKDKQR